MVTYHQVTKPNTETDKRTEVDNGQPNVVNIVTETSEVTANAQEILQKNGQRAKPVTVQPNVQITKQKAQQLLQIGNQSLKTSVLSVLAAVATSVLLRFGKNANKTK